MHIVTLGSKKELMTSALRLANHITILYEAWEEFRVAPFRESVTHWCAVESYLSIETLLAGLYHTGAIKKTINAIVPVGETGVVPAAILGKLIGARALPIDVAMRCRDKALQKDAWIKAGIPTARFIVIQDVLVQKEKIAIMIKEANLTGPFVLKPLSLYGSRKIHIAADINQVINISEAMVRADPKMRCLLIEQFTSGKEWHLDGVLWQGEIHSLSISNYLQPIIENRNGKCLASITYRPQANLNLYQSGYEFSKKALLSLGLKDCVFHLEAFTQNDNYQFIAGELAARPAGAYAGPVLSHMLNFDIWDAHLKICLGIMPSISNKESNYSWGYTALACVPGEINRLRVEDFSDIPEVVEANIFHPYGEIMPDMRENSSVAIGFALLRCENETACRNTILQVQERVLRIHSLRNIEIFV